MSSATVRQMERSARKRWNERRRKGNFEPLPETPSEWLVEHRALLGGSGRALDVACGDGRDALFLARLGYDIDAVDVSDVAIEAIRAAAAERALPIHPRVVDLEREPLPENEYDAVVCFNYLQRDLFGQLERALRPGGLLVFETFGRAHIDELGKEFNPTYVLDRNELLRAFPGLHVVHYQEGVAERSGALRGVAGIVAQRLARSSAGRTSAGQTTKLRHEGVAFEVWDAAEPSVRLKTRPRIVLDFFGRPWVDEFCAEPLTDSDRLDAAEIARLRGVKIPVGSAGEQVVTRRADLPVGVPLLHVDKRGAEHGDEATSDRRTEEQRNPSQRLPARPLRSAERTSVNSSATKPPKDQPCSTRWSGPRVAVKARRNRALGSARAAFQCGDAV